MEQPKHTPEPWETYPSFPCLVVAADQQLVARTDVTTFVGDQKERTEENVANARLVAASPNLLAVAIKAAGLEGCVCHVLKNDMCLSCSARAAIAKAEPPRG